MTDHPNGNGGRARAVVLWTFAVVLCVLLFTIGLLLAKIAEDRAADNERACRSRIGAHADQLRDEQGTALADGLAASVIERQQIDARALAQQIHDLGKQVRAAGDLRKRADGICAENPDFNP